ncbi:hypothetical protein EMIT074MI3_10128 [Bacillus licheniformis]
MEFLSVKVRREACSPLAYAYGRSAGSNPAGGIDYISGLEEELKNRQKFTVCFLRL